jgi:hypothetical protein
MHQKCVHGFEMCVFGSECYCVGASLCKREVFDDLYCDIRYFESAFLRRVSHDGGVKFTDWVPTTGLTMHAMEKLLLGKPSHQTLHKTSPRREISNLIESTS